MADQESVAEGAEIISAMKVFIYEIVVCLADRPSEVSVQAITKGEITSLEVSVASEDMGKIVGKEGRTARSLRTILSAASTKRKQKFSLDILDCSCMNQ